MQVKDLGIFFGNIFLFTLIFYFCCLCQVCLKLQLLDPSSLGPDRISVWVHEGDTSGTSIEKNNCSKKSLLRPRKCAFSFSWYFLMFKSDGQDLHLSTVARTYTNSYFSKTSKVKYISSLQFGNQNFHVKIIFQGTTAKLLKENFRI